MGSNPFNADAVCLGQDIHIDEARCCSGRGDDLLGRLASENVPSKETTRWLRREPKEGQDDEDGGRLYSCASETEGTT